MRRCGGPLAGRGRRRDDHADQFAGVERADLIAPRLFEEKIEAGGAIGGDRVGQAEAGDDEGLPARAGDSEVDLGAGVDADRDGLLAGPPDPGVDKAGDLRGGSLERRESLGAGTGAALVAGGLRAPLVRGGPGRARCTGWSGGSVAGR